jgi:ATP adenylyltransferase
MDYLFTPWRYSYIITAGKTPGCLFCEQAGLGDDHKALIVYRGRHCFIMLNAFPYTSGHVLIAPYQHVDELAKVSSEAASEIMALTRRMETVLRAAYHPDGINLGMNLGSAAGAGVAGHVHMHVLPRWLGDTSFLTTVGETRIAPEDLATTYDKLKKQLAISN